MPARLKRALFGANFSGLFGTEKFPSNVKLRGTRENDRECNRNGHWGTVGGQTHNFETKKQKKDLDFASKSLFLLEPGKRIELSTY